MGYEWRRLWRKTIAFDMSLIGRNSRVLARMSRNYATYDSSKYRNPNGTMTAAAIRARRPYAVKNAILGGSILAFAGFCCKYLSWIPGY